MIYEYRVIYETDNEDGKRQQYFDLKSFQTANSLVELLSKLRNHYQAIWIERRKVEHRKEVIGNWEIVNPTSAPNRP
jgi:hypothetical protein